MIVYTSVDNGWRYTYLSGEHLCVQIEMKAPKNAESEKSR